MNITKLKKHLVARGTELNVTLIEFNGRICNLQESFRVDNIYGDPGAKIKVIK